MDLIFLRIFKDEKLIEVKQFPLAQVVIGREGDVNLKLPDAEISPVHAVIEKRDSGFFVCDMGSGTGTYKNGMRVLDDAITSGDEIIVGPYKIEFHIGVPKPAAKPAAPPPTTPPPKRELPKEIKVEAKTEIKKPAKKDVERPTMPAAPVALSIPAEPYSQPDGPGTFAPESEIKDLNKVIKSSQGNLVEVIVCWKERVLTTYHFSKAGKTVTVGAHPKNDILLPVFTDAKFSFALLKVGNPATVYVTSDMKGEVRVNDSGQKIQDLIALNKLRHEGVGFAIDLQQNNVVRIELGEVTIFIRYGTETVKPLIAPILNLTSSELTTLVLTSVFFGVFWIYLLLYSPPPPEEKPEDEPKRTAVFVYKRAERIEPVEEKPAQKAKGETIKDQEVAKSRIEEGKAAEAKPNKSKSEVQKLTTDTPGKDKGISKAAANTGQADAAPKPKKDVSKLGLGGVFGKNGLQDDIDKAASGSGVVGSAAKSASGTGGQFAAGAGDEPGLGMKDIGKGGTGTATVGIGGIGTQGRGGGREGYGTGPMGGKRNATIIAGGEGEEFNGTIDREGIRRVLKENERQFRACYEKVLNKRPDLFGKIAMTWDINDKGRLANGHVKTSTLNNSEVEQCILLRLRTLKFPESPPGQTAVVTFPWVFNSK